MADQQSQISASNRIDIQKLNDEAYSFMMLGEEEFKDKKLRVAKNAKGQWVVDMTQFRDTDHSIGVAPQYAELRCID